MLRSRHPRTPATPKQGLHITRKCWRTDLQLWELVGPLRRHAGETFQAEAALPVWGEHTSYRDLNGLLSYPKWRPRVCFCTRRERFYCPTERWPGRRTCARQTPVSAVPVWYWLILSYHQHCGKFRGSYHLLTCNLEKYFFCLCLCNVSISS